MTWTTPVLIEICVGLEINGYLPGGWLRAARNLIPILRLVDLSNARVLRAFVFLNGKAH
jgi:coenzyme PQQ precursor peptide PqqA